MTGTAKSAAAEFYEIYGLRVVPIPTNKPPHRKDLPLRLYYTEKVSATADSVPNTMQHTIEKMCTCFGHSTPHSLCAQPLARVEQ
jgi:preprotein translocase subunit SecA